MQCKILIFPLLAMNHLKAWINESVSILQVHSIWTALLAKQVKSVLYLFSSFLPSFIKKGPNMSTPQFVNGGPSRVLSVGKSAIFCSPSLPLSRQHLTHFPTKLLTTVLHLTTHKPLLLTSLSVHIMPCPVHCQPHFITLLMTILMLIGMVFVII